MTVPIDISPNDLETVRKILAEHIPEHGVWAFGSRVSWTARQYSDLDLAVMTEKPLDILRISDLCEALSQSDLPFRVDVVDWASISESFRRIIEKKYAVVQQGINKLKLNGWREFTIGEIADVVGGGTPSTKKPENFNGDIPWLTPKDLSGTHDRYIGRGKRNLSQKGLENSSAKLLPTGSVLLSTRAPIGYVALAKNPIATNQGFRSLLVKEGFSAEYLYYWLIQNTEELKRHASGSTFSELSGSALRNIRLKLPPLPEQLAISHILGTLDDKIELNRQMNNTLEAMVRTLFKSWFIDFDPVRAKMEGLWRRGEPLFGLPANLRDLFPNRLVDSELGEIPESWDIKTLDEIVVETKGRSYKSADIAESKIALVTLKSFNRGGGYRSEGLKPYTGPYKPEQVVEPGEVIVACTDVTQNAEVIGRSAMVQPSSHYMRLIASLDTVIVRPNGNRISNEFLYLLCGTQAFTNHTYSYTTGTTVLHLAKEAIPSFQFVLPTYEIMLAFGKIVANIYKKIFYLGEETNMLAELRNILLPKLVSGELRVDSLNTSYYD